jgi:hypothetical protein
MTEVNQESEQENTQNQSVDDCTDYFELKITESASLDNINSQSNLYSPVEIYINDRYLIDIIREFEEKLFTQEFAEKFWNSGDENKLDIPAGDYSSLVASEYYLPSQNLLGRESYNVFEFEKDDIHFGKSLLLECSCEIFGCWDLVAKIEVTEKYVTWSRFGQVHLDCDYELGPFIFNRRQYEAQLVNPFIDEISDTKTQKKSKQELVSERLVELGFAEWNQKDKKN